MEILNELIKIAAVTALVSFPAKWIWSMIADKKASKNKKDDDQDSEIKEIWKEVSVIKKDQSAQYEELREVFHDGVNQIKDEIGKVRERLAKVETSLETRFAMLKKIEG